MQNKILIRFWVTILALFLVASPLEAIWPFSKREPRTVNVEAERIPQRLIKRAIKVEKDEPKSSASKSRTKQKSKSSSPSAKKVPIIILPPEYVSRPVIVRDSPEYQELLLKNQFLAAQHEAEKQTFSNYKAKVDKTLIAKADYILTLEENLAKAQTKAKKNWFAAIFGWVLGLGFPILGLGLIALCVFNPAILGSLINIFINIVGFIARIFGRSLEGVASVTKRKT